MSTQQSLILNATQITQKIRRIAYEIHENNFKEDHIILAGIEGQGYTLAQEIAAELRTISPMTTRLVKVGIDKSKPQFSNVTIDCEAADINRKCVILVDDVLNTGRTLAYALKPFLSVDVKKIETAVLVNRSHTNFPIYPQYTGYELPTTLNEHVEVKFGKDSAVYLV